MPKARKYLFKEGDRIGRLLVVGDEMRPRPDGRNRRYIQCLCDCGERVSVIPYNLGTGDTKSCGCFHRERASEANTIHGGKTSKGPTSLYNVWRGMRSRCYNPNAHNYKWYGGKGVSISWEKFSDFEMWAQANGFKKGLQLDRNDRDGPYSPDNCWWVTPEDNLLRAGLHIDRTVDDLAVQYAKEHGMSFNEVVELALLSVVGGEGV